MAGVLQSPPGGFDDILSEQILMADNQRLERGVELIPVSQDPETALQVPTDNEFGQRLDRTVPFRSSDAFAPQGTPISLSYRVMTTSISRDRADSDMVDSLDEMRRPRDSGKWNLRASWTKGDWKPAMQFIDHRLPVAARYGTPGYRRLARGKATD